MVNDDYALSKSHNIHTHTNVAERTRSLDRTKNNPMLFDTEHINDNDRNDYYYSYYYSTYTKSDGVSPAR